MTESKDKKKTVEERLAATEQSLQVLWGEHKMLNSAVEHNFGEDFNKDGKIGSMSIKSIFAMLAIGLISFMAMAGSRTLRSFVEVDGDTVFSVTTDDDGTSDIDLSGGEIIGSITLSNVTFQSDITANGDIDGDGATQVTNVFDVYIVEDLLVGTNLTVEGDITANGNITGDAATIISNVTDIVVDDRDVVRGPDAGTALGLRFGTATNGEVVTFSPVFLGTPAVTVSWTDPLGIMDTGTMIRVVIATNTATFSSPTAAATNLSWIAVGDEE